MPFIAIDVNSPIQKLKDKFIKTKLSKILIFKENIDKVIGYVHSSDLFKRPITIKSIMLPIPIVSESLTANEMLRLQNVYKGNETRKLELY